MTIIPLRHGIVNIVKILTMDMANDSKYFLEIVDAVLFHTYKQTTV